MARHSERQELKRQLALEEIAKQVKRGNLTIRRATNAELRRLDEQVARRRVTVEMVDIEVVP